MRCRLASAIDIASHAGVAAAKVCGGSALAKLNGSHSRMQAKEVASGTLRSPTGSQRALGTQAMAVRSQTYYLDITPPGCDKGTFVQAMARRLGISTDAVATIGDMQNDLPMFRTSGMSFAMGNATDDVKKQATHVTASNEDDGFAKAIPCGQMR